MFLKFYHLFIMHEPEEGPLEAPIHIPNQRRKSNLEPCHRGEEVLQDWAFTLWNLMLIPGDYDLVGWIIRNLDDMENLLVGVGKFSYYTSLPLLQWNWVQTVTNYLTSLKMPLHNFAHPASLLSSLTLLTWWLYHLASDGWTASAGLYYFWDALIPALSEPVL